MLVQLVLVKESGNEVVVSTRTLDSQGEIITKEHELLSWRDIWAKAMLGETRRFIGTGPLTLLGHWTDHQKSLYLRY
jgi:hypothetical protein